MIKAVIEYKGNTLITELPDGYLRIYEDDIRIKLYADSDFGNHLLRLFSEENTLADANTVYHFIGKTDESIKE